MTVSVKFALQTAKCRYIRRSVWKDFDHIEEYTSLSLSLSYSTLFGNLEITVEETRNRN